jgi:mannose-6-phosphate isomerase-like protein (cupin superfamily)
MNKHNVLDQKSVSSFISDEVGRDAVLAFSNSTLFYDNEHRYETNFYGRRLRPHVLKHLELSTPLKVEGLLDYSSFAANRVLFAMNESEFLMLPQEGQFDPNCFRDFYSPERRTSASIGAAYLEKYIFSCLEDEIRVSDSWPLDHVREYFENYARTSQSTQALLSADAIREASDPANAAKDWLVQLAPDFLIESSPMARYASGSYGEIGSNLFKIIIDELGYGEFPKKHSTLFEETLKSVGLSHVPHTYWQYYLNSSLILADYYNMITRNKDNIFRYIGAIYNAETGFITSCRIWRDVLREALPNIDVRYFNEHCHIDIDHSRMAFEGLVAPAIEKYGSFAAREIVRGFEEARWLGEFAERDFANQVKWKDDASCNVALYGSIYPKIRDRDDISCGEFVEPKGELSITHTHDEDELCHIVSGEMEFLNGFEKSTTLQPGEGIVIRKNRLHGALIKSDECVYRIHTIHDAEKWA